jgi:prepilin signal peptidase PulO-like enzyme (type II secretory pathway)
MNELMVYIALIVFGAAFGSFAGATVWRLRARQLEADKKSHEPYDKKEYTRLKKLLGARVSNDRSRCLHCNHVLKWYDLIPIVSWLSLGGRCRYCKTRIGLFELAMELGVAAFFVASYLWWPAELDSALAVTHFILWLIAGVVMAILFAYDTKWFLLPDKASLALALVGVAIVGIVSAQGDTWGVILNAVGAVGVLAGLYGLLYAVSRGQWVGFGDVKLGVGLGLLVLDWRLALLALFLANLIGCLIVIPLMLVKKLTRTSRVPFGPMLIAGTVLAWLFGWPLLDMYLMSFGA